MLHVCFCSKEITSLYFGEIYGLICGIILYFMRYHKCLELPSFTFYRKRKVALNKLEWSDPGLLYKLNLRPKRDRFQFNF